MDTENSRMADLPEGMRSVLVTGCTGGLGQVLVHRLVNAGFQVLAGVRSTDAGREIAAHTPGVVPIGFDLTDDAAIQRAVNEVSKHVGNKGLYALVNNAGLSVDGPLEWLTMDALRHQFDVNVFGQVALSQACLPLLRAARGRIVNMGGAAGRMALPMYGALSASKAALDSISNALRMELKHQGVHVIYIESGGLQTNFFGKSAYASTSTRRIGAPDLARLYGPAMEAAHRALAAAPATPVNRAANTIVKALTDRRPAARYLVGLDARMGMLILRKLPTSWRDFILMSSLGLKRSLFPST